MEEIEARNGLRLPEGYRRYLLEFGAADTGLLALFRDLPHSHP